jgi:4-amino-4-deoxy-L-arabinose transferase-like glycosyltransferase
MPFVESLAKGCNSLGSITTMLMLLLIATSVLGFSSSSSSSSSYYYLTPYAAASPISMNAAATTTTATTTPITYTIKLGEEPFALGRYTPVSQTMIDKTLQQQQQLKLVFEGSTTITLPKQCLIERVKGEHFGPEQFLL